MYTLATEGSQGITANFDPRDKGSDGLMTNENFYLAVQMDIQPEKEEIFHQIYREEHMRFMLEVPGITSVQRLESLHTHPKHLALYQIASPDVLDSPEYLLARDTGRWPSDVRPFTSNRARHIYRTIDFRSVGD